MLHNVKASHGDILKGLPELNALLPPPARKKQLLLEMATKGEQRPSQKTKIGRALATRIALTVCMLADDPEIITPDVLKDDQGRYEKEKDEAWKRTAERRARNKGVFGWSIGKNIEVAPHVRRPHWAIRHKGKGQKKTPELVRVKGCKVKGGKLTTVPTGYMRDDGTEIEPALS